MKYPSKIVLAAVALRLGACFAGADGEDYKSLGYMYLSPSPGAEYTSPQTKFVLMRFIDFSPSLITNLSQCIQVTGAISGNHAGQTKIAGDGRTVIFEMSVNFQANELVTVNLTPLLSSGAIQPYQYQFMISGTMPVAPIVTARGDNPPDETKERAFDRNPSTKWLDLVVPDGTTNFSWIQYDYSGTEIHVVNQYAIISANDAPERDPQDWRLYGVDASSALTLLDTRTGQIFAGRNQTNSYIFTNTTDFVAYRLEITRVANSAVATGIQLAELVLIDASGSILREYWTDITGSAVSDLTSNPNYPDSPTGTDQLVRFEAPTDWADYYGTRVRGYLTAPSTGSYVFWISSDDDSQLFLSTDATPANKLLIASVTGWTNPREWSKYASQRSTNINLTAGQQYYIEALQKEHTGGDNLAVGWAKPGQGTSTPSEVIPGWALSPWVDVGESSPAPAVANRPGPSPVGASTSTSAGGKVVSGERGLSKDSPKLELMTTSLASPGVAGIMPNGVSVPSDFPFINITTNDNPDPEYIFIDNRGGGGKNYNIIFDNAGSPIWYMKMPDERRDMKVQHNGVLTMLARTGGMRFVGLNTHYEEIASYWAVNGYTVDEHELQVLADGTYLLIGLRSERVDMSRYISGGNPSASVTEQVIQQFTAAGELIFQWRAWDHLDVVDQQDFINIKGASFDFPHMNAIDIDTDGHILLSSRNTSEVTKINADTGDIIWRLGGDRNQFNYVNDTLDGPKNQHAIRTVGTNRYTVFDNGNLHSPSVSRALEYQLDPSNLTATIVWQYPPTPTTSLYSHYMGNSQRLSNGNTLINWAVGGLPKLTEIRPNGTKAFEMNWVNGYEAYRVWRCPWQGMALKPNLIVESYPDRVLLLFNKFGDTNVGYYRIYGGTSPAPTNVLATSTVTMANLTALENKQQYYFRVTAVDTSGAESGFSPEQSVFVDLVKPGENMVLNGDFAAGTNSWAWSVSGSATAGWRVTNGTAFIDMTNAGTALSDAQLRQLGIKLLQGRSYVLEFDAWAPQPRVIEARLGQSQSPFTGYLIANPSLTPVSQHFKYSFVMANATDLNTRVVFNFGTSTRDVYLDNVAVWMVIPGDLNLDRCVNYTDLELLTDQWLQQGTGLAADLNGDGRVDFKDFAILGENWSTVNCP